MKDSMYQHVCTTMVGVATLFRFMGYDMVSFMVESLVHSAHLREPTAMIDHAGYYGQAIKEVAGCLSTFVVPIVLNYINPKWALVVASLLYAAYIACLFYMHTVVFFVASALLGFAYSLCYTAFSTYQMQFSTRKTLARNSAIIWSIAGLSLIFGGLFYMYVTSEHGDQIGYSTGSNVTSQPQFRYYTVEETRWLCGIFCAFSCIAVIIQCFYPTREARSPQSNLLVDGSVSSENPHAKLSLRDQVLATGSVLIHPRVLVFLPRWIAHGLFVSFYMNIYPTTLQYSTVLASKYPMLTAYYAFAMCAGSTVCGFLIAPLNRRFQDFGLRPIYYLTIGVQLLTYLVAALTTPNWSTAHPTTEGAVVEPEIGWVCLVAFLLGFADTTNTASNTVICSRLIHGRASHSYSAARFYFGIAASVIFFMSPMLSMRAHALILMSPTLISAISFNFAVKQIEKSDEYPTSNESESAKTQESSQ